MGARTKSKRHHAERRAVHAPWVWSTLLPNALVVLAALMAVSWEYTTHSAYTQSSTLNRFLRQCFVAYVCLAVRSQLIPLFLPMSKKVTISRIFKAELQGLVAAVVANCAGSSVIQPLCGCSPDYGKIINMVIPIYSSIAAIVGLFHVPSAVVQLGVGLCVGWLKAMTIVGLVRKWRLEGDSHPVSFVLICTANLFASGLTISFIGHWYRSSRVFQFSMGLARDLMQMMAVASVMGVVAHFGDEFANNEQRKREATWLFFLVAWYALNKYWKKALATFFTQPYTQKLKAA